MRKSKSKRPTLSKKDRVIISEYGQSFDSLVKHVDRNTVQVKRCKMASISSNCDAESIGLHLPSSFGPEEQVSKTYDDLLSLLKPHQRSIMVKSRKDDHVTSELSDVDFKSDEDCNIELEEPGTSDFYDGHFDLDSCPCYQDFLTHCEKIANSGYENHISTQNSTSGDIILSTNAEVKCDLDSLLRLSDLAKTKNRLKAPWKRLNAGEDGMSELQGSLYSVMHHYKDLLYFSRNIVDFTDVAKVYTLHAMNHVFKTRDRILKNSEKVKSSSECIEKRDQGFTRPKILIVLPFKNSAFEVIKMIIELSDSVQQENIKRFIQEFGVAEDETDTDAGTKPEDYKFTFRDNIDDCFRIGIKLNRKSMKLYSEFYSSDIIVASPLGLRLIIGSAGDKERDFDFLSSIEVLIMDQLDVLLMQNWDHVTHLMDHLNLLPKELHDCDFSRVRNWYLDNKSGYVRQNILISSFPSPEMNALAGNHCRNYEGRVKIRRKSPGMMNNIVVPTQNVFHRISCPDSTAACEARFCCFINKILPSLRKSIVLSQHTCIVIPSYFDFLRLKNWFTENEVSFTALCEYTSESNISRARSDFFHGQKDFLLITERFHFYRRYRIRGIHRVVFYSLPDNPSFYSEFVNMTAQVENGDDADGAIDSNSVVSLFTKFDALKLERIVGTDRAKRLLLSEKNVFVFA